MTIAIAFVISAGVLLYAFGKLSGARSRMADPVAVSAPKKSRRQRKIERILGPEDDLPEPKSVFDLMMEEAADLGVTEVATPDGLEMPVRLKVWKRDIARHQDCREELRFAVAEGVEPATATMDQVHLVCAAGHVAAGEDGDTTEVEDLS